ncbi:MULTISPECIES: SIR2 family protein [Enterobacter cloacae complex]|uniref:SIR2 family protein n=1 Tax=Enterobacter cloacae complex TaxID=354276 RepID=UPI0008FB5413|nr:MULTISPECIES: SIR2 family protein [Enterobacter cloacae complex]WFC85830.1 SIR2 family protein [Enterobacter roggenkampii]
MSASAIENIKESILKDELVVVIGTGCSIALTDNSNKILSWKGLIESGFDYATVKGKISNEQKGFWSNQLASNDIDDLLSAAEFVGRKLDSPSGDLYSRWLSESFDKIKPTNKNMMEVVRNISNSGVLICTLNYDSLLEKTTGLSTVLLSETRKATAWLRGEEKGILHLHGHWEQPNSCVLGIRDYEKTIDNELRDLFQRTLGAFKRLLFIGCGDTFSDPNFSALSDWLRTQLSSNSLQHYALVDEKQILMRHADPKWQGFVEPVSYGAIHTELPVFLNSLFIQESRKRKTKKQPIEKNNRNQKNIKLLSVYKEFLVKDCGQMTIEGVRADMDTAQRRFDLERLFVPLELLPCPPDISLDDPEREKKLNNWLEKNKEVKQFGDVFSKTKGIALLALPGGGKSLLLKRLAVAYASPDRRSSSDDNLPDIDLMPVLIRCREWRDYITLPIATMLRKLPDISGQSVLEGVGTALISQFSKGNVLLLVDGLDEIHDDGERTIFAENLRNFIDQYPKTKLVITSREAGFSLVAPFLASYCEQWRVAPLNPQTIKILCNYWHQLMVGQSPEAISDAERLGEVLVSNQSLKRLAENPLLLTMLLVVKHGAGRLPPDRVSLYSRAVEVLLDTWNIKGHEALNTKEAIPQLSYVAFELMKAGKQTATETELLNLLEQARENVPQIKRYAKDTPYEFLKRVELRSSLLLEAGHQVENGRAVPFYQFRHLTFQEYLTALAIVDGNYNGYDSKSPMKPLNSYLDSEEWKEIVPMSAVLAGKQGDIILRVLVQKGKALKRKVDLGHNFKEKAKWISFPRVLPNVIGRLVQSLIEEAQAEPETLTEALNLVAYFSRGCEAALDWRALCSGPYSDELIKQAWILYEPMNLPFETWIRNSYASFAVYRKQSSYWFSDDGYNEISELLSSSSDEKKCLGLMICAGINWAMSLPSNLVNEIISKVFPRVEQLVLDKNKAISNVALWVWGLRCNSSDFNYTPPLNILDEILKGLLSACGKIPFDIYSFSMGACFGLKRDYWSPVLNQEEIDLLRSCYDGLIENSYEKHRMGGAIVVVAFHSKSILTDEQIVSYITEVRNGPKGISEYNLEKLNKTISQINPQALGFLISQEEGNDITS